MGMAESILFGIRIKMLTRFTTVVCGRGTAEGVGITIKADLEAPS